MAEHKIINLADPVNPQDMATKAYVDSVMAPKPADIPIIAWAFSPSPDEATMRSQYQGLLNLGINAFLSQRHLSHDPYDFRETTAYYDLVFNVAADMHLKVYWYGGIHRLYLPYVSPSGQYFLEFAKDYSAWGGWEWGDEPNYMSQEGGCNWPWSELREAYLWAKSLDPDHLYFAVWGYDLSVCYHQTYSGSSPPYGCGLFDVGCECIYPTALWGDLEWGRCVDKDKYLDPTDDHGNPFDYWINYGRQIGLLDNNDGFGDCGKGMIPVIQAYVEYNADRPTLNGLMPCLLDQLERWQHFYPGDEMKGIGLWPYSGFMGAGSDKANIRAQIKDLARALGWGG